MLAYNLIIRSVAMPAGMDDLGQTGRADHGISALFDALDVHGLQVRIAADDARVRCFGHKESIVNKW